MMKTHQEKRIILYQNGRGKEPFTIWLNRLRDAKIRRRVLQRLSRVEGGNYGDFKSLKDGVFELRLTFGSGYRVYFGEDGDTIVVLLCGGDKSTQQRDIENAKLYWKEYREHAGI